MALRGGGNIVISYPVGTGGVTKNRVVRLGASGDAGKAIAVSAIDSQYPVGVAKETVSAGGNVDVQIFGKCAIEAGTGGLTSGSMVSFDAVGKAVNATRADTTTSTFTHFCIGIAEETVSAGEIGTVVLNGMSTYVNTSDTAQ